LFAWSVKNPFALCVASVLLCGKLNSKENNDNSDEESIFGERSKDGDGQGDPPEPHNDERTFYGHWYEYGLMVYLFGRPYCDV